MLSLSQVSLTGYLSHQSLIIPTRAQLKITISLNQQPAPKYIILVINLVQDNWLFVQCCIADSCNYRSSIHISIAIAVHPGALWTRWSMQRAMFHTAIIIVTILCNNCEKNQGYRDGTNIKKVLKQGCGDFFTSNICHPYNYNNIIQIVNRYF